METPNLNIIPHSGAHAIGFQTDGNDLLIALLVRSKGQVHIASIQRLTLTAAIDTPDQANAMQPAAVEASPFGADLEAAVSGLVETFEKSEDDDRIIASAMQSMPVGKSKLGFAISPVNVRFYNGGELLPGEKPGNFGQRVRAEAQTIIGEEVTNSNSYVEIQKNGPAWCFVHRDKFKLIDRFGELKNQFGNPRLRYELIDTVEVALTGMMNMEWPASTGEVTVYIHIGKEYTHLMVLREDEVIAVAPLIPTGSSPQSLLQTLTSKILFEQDELGIPEVHRFALSGNVENNGAREFFEHRYPHAALRVIMNGGCDDSLLSTEEHAILSEFTVSIGIALKMLEPKLFWKSNMLPETIRRSQRVLSFAWHTYLLLALLFVSTMGVTFRSVGERKELLFQKRMFTQKQAQDQINLALHSELDTLNLNINDMQRLLKLSDSLSIGSHRWSSVLSELNDKGNKIKSIWIESIQTGKHGITLMGKSLYLSRVNDIAKIFPNTVILSVNRISVQKKTIYKFELKIPYPPDEPPHDPTSLKSGVVPGSESDSSKAADPGSNYERPDAMGGSKSGGVS